MTLAQNHQFKGLKEPGVQLFESEQAAGPVVFQYDILVWA